MIRRAVSFIKEVRSEMGQVSWSTPRELWESTRVVLVVTALLSGVIGLFDFVCARLMAWLIR